MINYTKCTLEKMKGFNLGKKGHSRERNNKCPKLQHPKIAHTLKNGGPIITNDQLDPSTIRTTVKRLKKPQ